MTSRAPAKRKRDTFHHGNLREALLEAAMAVLDQSGAEAVTIREVARRSGVSHAAPVNHFRDRTALLTAVAVRLFGDLETQIGEQLDRTETEPAAQVGAFALALVRYGLAHPFRYEFLWRRDLIDNSDDALERAMNRIYDRLIACIGEIGGNPQCDAHTVAIAFWSLAHGYVSMRINGNFEPIADTVSGKEREKAIVDLLLTALQF
ncbi:TetR/AcrR family transcriptional regulator [Erythrobacter mangrovi]|uniref:TetR/AcrR family transcriptional regulator n=1 Tax=Erythrobacter mangrovi TaxID=2739433 RepID=A0A7D3XGQ1_9SPHN|nr:TetR/AcrR family transcriptional regulator [Erythrobacter mangrovi]QKG70653.1 TetR/AcrR family transcriptional regulator [Erythrobacter mangrovi]